MPTKKVKMRNSFFCFSFAFLLFGYFFSGSPRATPRGKLFIIIDWGTDPGEVTRTLTLPPCLAKMASEGLTLPHVGTPSADPFDLLNELGDLRSESKAVLLGPSASVVEGEGSKEKKPRWHSFYNEVFLFGGLRKDILRLLQRFGFPNPVNEKELSVAKYVRNLYGPQVKPEEELFCKSLPLFSGSFDLREKILEASDNLLASPRVPGAVTVLLPFGRKAIPGKARASEKSLQHVDRLLSRVFSLKTEKNILYLCLPLKGQGPTSGCAFLWGPPFKRNKVVARSVLVRELFKAVRFAHGLPVQMQEEFEKLKKILFR